MRAILAVWIFSFFSSTISWASVTPTRPSTFIATAYSRSGVTASGAATRIGLVPRPTRPFYRLVH